MSPAASRKTKLGRNPFDKGTAAPRSAAPKKIAAASKKKPRKPQERIYRRKKGSGFSHYFTEFTHYWIPRAKACAYMRAVKFFAKRAA
ncbi:MAG: hypothetical protein HY074_13845 [Deltaproteobacteria bacterium]|nr:hypothetical protein [Deltaproteobacteria bacterium]